MCKYELIFPVCATSGPDVEGMCWTRGRDSGLFAGVVQNVIAPLQDEATWDLHVHPASPSPPIRASRVKNLEGTLGPAGLTE